MSNMQDDPIDAIEQKLKSMNDPEPQERHFFQNPMLMETTMTLSWMFVLIIGILVTLLSFLSGSRGLDLLIRSGSAIILSGLLAWFITNMVTKGYSEAARRHADQQEKKKKNNETTWDIEA